MSWWRRLRDRGRTEDELDRELRDHVERQVADHLRAGLPEDEARRRARLEFGGLDQVKELCRDAGGARWLDDLGRDLRYALRRQFTGRGSGVSAFAVAALALGIGAGTAMFSVLDAVVLQPLPFPREDRLVVGWKASRTDPGRFIELSYPEFLEWQAQSTSFDSLAALPTTVYGYSYVLTGRGDPLNVESARVTGEFFDALAVRPLLGRTFLAADDRVGARPTVVLTHPFWTNVLGADPGVVGSGLTLTGVDFTVIGVLPAGFVFPRGVDVFTALGTRPGLANNRTVFLKLVGRLRPGVSREQAASELDGIMSRLETQRPGALIGDRVAALTPLRDHVLGGSRLAASLLFAGAVVLLLVAGVNLGGLLATRAARRGGEVALRLGLGASTRHLVRQFVAEGLILATVGTVAGIGLAVVMLDAVVALAPDDIARMASAAIDGWSLLFATACLVLLTLGMGCVPLWLVRAPSIDTLLRRSAAGAGGSTRAARVGGALVTVEVTGTVALLVVACALAVSLANLRGANVGFDRDGVLTAFVNPSRARYPDAAARRRFFRDVMARLEANAEVDAAGAALLRPLEGVIGWGPALRASRPEPRGCGRQLHPEPGGGDARLVRGHRHPVAGRPRLRRNGRSAHRRRPAEPRCTTRRRARGRPAAAHERRAHGRAPAAGGHRQREHGPRDVRVPAGRRRQAVRRRPQRTALLSHRRRRGRRPATAACTRSAATCSCPIRRRPSRCGTSWSAPLRAPPPRGGCCAARSPRPTRNSR